MAASPTKNRFLKAFDPTQARADTAQDFYLNRSTTFDPSAAMQKYGDAAYSRFSKGLTRDVESLRGQQVGMGRLDTGFATQDEDRLVTESGDRFRGDIASHALDAAGLDLRNIEGVGQYGQNQGNTYLDMLSGQLDRETAESNAKKQMWSSILSSAFGAGGMIAGAKVK